MRSTSLERAGWAILHLPHQLDCRQSITVLSDDIAICPRWTPKASGARGLALPAVERRGTGLPHLLGTTELGAAWRRTKQGTDQTYLRVRLDDPAWPQPIWGVLLESTEDGLVRLIWRRDTREEGSDNAR
jgi:Protein of unknown function (DUF736)